MVHQKATLRQGESAREDVFSGRGEFVEWRRLPSTLGSTSASKLVDVPKNVEPDVPSVQVRGRSAFVAARASCHRGASRIEEYYTRAAHPYLNETVQRWKRIVGAEPGRFVQVMDLGYRWGSCSADGTLNFHWRVMQLPPKIIEYVVVHELVHIKVPDHSEKFWKTLGSVMPDYESRKAWLKQKGGDL